MDQNSSSHKPHDPNPWRTANDVECVSYGWARQVPIGAPEGFVLSFMPGLSYCQRRDCYPDS